jgi:hypothetical protein
MKIRLKHCDSFVDDMIDMRACIAEPQITPWSDNEKSGQLSVFDTRAEGGYEKGDYCVIQRAVQLQVKSWCHGEIRVSLTPRMPRPLDQPLRRVFDSAPAVVQRREGTRATGSGRKEDVEGRLVRRQEFQDDTELVSGFGRLPRQSVLTRYSARQAEECSAVAQRYCGLSGVFLTGTLAGSMDSAFRTLAEYSGYVVSLVRQWLRDNLVGRHHVFGVWEHQKRGALHLHVAVMSRDTDNLQKLCRGFHSYWRRILVRISDETGVDLFQKNENFSWKDDESKPRTDAGLLRKSPASYLGKYCGKDAMKGHQTARYCPSRWLTVDRETSREAAAERIKLVLGSHDASQAKLIFDNILELAQSFSSKGFFYTNPIYLDDITWVLYGDAKAVRMQMFNFEQTMHFLKDN